MRRNAQCHLQQDIRARLVGCKLLDRLPNARDSVCCINRGAFAELRRQSELPIARDAPRHITLLQEVLVLGFLLRLEILHAIIRILSLVAVVAVVVVMKLPSTAVPASDASRREFR